MVVYSTAKLQVILKEETSLLLICFPPYVFECHVCSVNERGRRDVPFYAVHLFIYIFSCLYFNLPLSGDAYNWEAQYTFFDRTGQVWNQWKNKVLVNNYMLYKDQLG